MAADYLRATDPNTAAVRADHPTVVAEAGGSGS
jgi:hypothetical protein